MDMGSQDGGFRPLWEPASLAKAAGRSLLDLIFPPQLLDGGPRPQLTGLSAEAWSRISFIDDPACDGCGLAFEFSPGPGVRCPDCEARPRQFDRARAACYYDDHSRDLILQLKHADRTDLAPLFACWLSRSARGLIADADVLIPVPLHRRRLLARRYNQMAEIARPLSRITGLTYLPDSLIRTRATDSQGGKSGTGRRRNVAQAFAVPDGKASGLAGKRVLLIDDVLTTGATAEACAMALKQAGAARVDLAVIARVKEASNRPI
jgi:ComF family protein